MITNNIQEERTPVFGDAPEPEAPSENKVLSWEEEKTLLVFEDDEPSTAARLLNAETGEAIDLDVFPFAIGRSSTANLLIKHRSVSREHAQIIQQPGGPGFIIQDVASSNGIRINGIKTTKVILTNKDVIKFGDVEFTFEVDQEEAATVIDSTSTEVVPSSLSDGNGGAERSKPTLNWAKMKARLPFLSAKDGAGDGTQSARSKYPLIAAVAAVVLIGAYFLSPARRVSIIEAPVASSETKPAASATAASEPAQASDAGASTEAGPSVNEQAVAAADTDAQSMTETPESADSANTVVSTSGANELAGNTASTSVAPEERAVAAVSNVSQNDAEPAVAVSGDLAKAPDATDSVTGGAETVAAASDSMVADGAAASKKAMTTATETAEVVAEPKREIIRRSPDWSRAYIRNSLNMYTEGDVENAVKRLRILSRSSRHQTQFRQEASGLADGIDSMYQQYQSGRSLFDSGNHDEAFLVWRSFLVDEANLLPGRESVYSSSIKSEVVNLYTQQGNTAYADGRQHDAYLAWQKASTIAPGGEAASALADLQKRAKERFIDGYMQESVSLQTATALWRDVVNMVPPANEYHIKAKAKLRLYKNYGS